MKLINRYVNEVGKNLPILKGREDIEKELRSTLEDMLEERVEKAGRPVDEAMEIELLKEYGSPQKVAMTYNPHPYLIGPRMFPFFLFVLKIVVPIVVIVLLVLTGIKAVTDTSLMGPEFVNIIGDGLAGIVSAGITAAGYVIVVFAILERVLPESEIDDLKTDTDWNPAELAKEPDSDSVKRGELIVEIVFTFIGLAIINGIFEIPIFTNEFLKFVPWINVVLITEILLDIYLLRKAVWDTGTRIVKIVMEAGTIAIAALMMRTPNVITFTEEFFRNIPENSSADVEFIARMFSLGVSIAFIVVIIVASVELVKAAIGLIRSFRLK